jgi:hypothetical protein
MSKTCPNRLILAGALALLLTGCPKPNPSAGPAAGLDAAMGIPPDASANANDGGPTTGLDASAPDTGPKVTACSVDDDCGPKERCSEAGACMPAVPCDDPSNCPPANDQDEIHMYCDNTVGLGCRCVVPSGETKGVCKRRLPPCAPCTEDEQCGNDPLYFQNAWHEPGHCVTLDGVKVCLEYFVSGGIKCPCGQSVPIDSKNYCAPQGSPASCAAGQFLCCQTDGNCPPEHPLCSGGRCKDICWYDFQKDETIGCRADKVCNVDPSFLNPTNKNYGAGSCSSPCTDDAACTPIRDDFVCRSEPKSDKRCRPEGCLDDFECMNPETDSGKPTFPYLGYCERQTGVCECHEPTNPNQSCNCRPGTNPVTSTPYKDCRDGFKCWQPSGAEPGQCIEKDCIENGGAQSYCGWTQFCCGEDRDSDPGTPYEPCVDLAGTTILADYGKCYNAPNPPWCTACEPTLTSGATDWLACNKPGYPTSTKDPNFCLDFGKDAKGKARGNSCIFACISSKQCPAGFHCSDRGFELDCSSDAAACGTGGNCTDTGMKDQNGNAIKWCKCTNAGVKGPECPAMDAADPTAPISRCSDGNSPFYHCIWTKGCVPQLSACLVP